jgi:hypothetical protein
MNAGLDPLFCPASNRLEQGARLALAQYGFYSSTSNNDGRKT